MTTHALTQCRAHCGAHGPQRRRGGVARITALALALGAAILAFSGEHWLLAEAPRSANELTLAACALDDAYGARPAAACLNASAPHDQGHTL